MVSPELLSPTLVPGTLELWNRGGADEPGTELPSFGVEPFAYLRDVLDRVSIHPASRIAELLPDAWKPLPRFGAVTFDPIKS